MQSSNQEHNGTGNALRVLRVAAGLTLAEVASAAGTSVSYLSNVETGKAEGSKAYFARVAEVIMLAFKRAA